MSISENKPQLFDAWPDKYRAWFETPIGGLVKKFEQELLLELLAPTADESILDVGCGSGLFTECLIEQGSRITGLDVSQPMLEAARDKFPRQAFSPLLADMRCLPFADEQFDKTVCITALEFIEDAVPAMAELFRVTRHQGRIVVATLNSASPWAKRRTASARANPDSVFREAFFRSPQELAKLAPVAGEIRTAIHFAKQADVETARLEESQGSRQQLQTGAFLIGAWNKP